MKTERITPTARKAAMWIANLVEDPRTGTGNKPIDDIAAIIQEAIDEEVKPWREIAGECAQIMAAGDYRNIQADVDAAHARWVVMENEALKH
jgi:hypothetical protein